MVNVKDFFQILDERGFGPYIGVPCSYLKPLINHIYNTKDLSFLPVNNEGEAVAIAAGMYLSGKKPVVLLQNSGLGNMVNPLTSLIHTFKIPILLLITWRGEPGTKDEPQHLLMGEILKNLLDALHVRYSNLPDNIEGISKSIDDSVDYMLETSLPFSLIIRNGIFGKCNLINDYSPVHQLESELSITKRKEEHGNAHILRKDVISEIVQVIPKESILVSTTGYTSRELFFCNDRPGNFYVIGSMGCTSSIGLGIAMCQSQRKIFILDGDGAALMRLESLASIGYYRPRNLVHVILDNNIYESTGGQPTLSSTVRFDEVAKACRYVSTISISDTDEIRDSIIQSLKSDGPHLIHIKILPGTASDLKRPTLTPIEIKDRFMKFLALVNEQYSI